MRLGRYFRLSVGEWATCSLAIGISLYAVCVAGQWLRYGKSPRRKRPPGPDDLFERFIPECDVAEVHEVFLECDPAVAYRLAYDLDPLDTPLVRSIFRTRSLLLRSSELLPDRTGGLVSYTRSIGWGVLVEVPGRAIVMGSITKPWESNVKFRSVPPEQFIEFNKPDFVKIVWTLQAENAPGGSLFRTETRAVATDGIARRKFRRYWAFFSPGVILIRKLLLLQLSRQVKSRSAREYIADGPLWHGPVEEVSR